MCMINNGCLVLRIKKTLDYKLKSKPDRQVLQVLLFFCVDINNIQTALRAVFLLCYYQKSRVLFSLEAQELNIPLQHDSNFVIFTNQLLCF